MIKSCTKSCAFSKCIGLPQLRVQLWGKTCSLTCSLIRTIVLLGLLSVGRMRKIAPLPLFSYLTTTFFRIHSQCSLLGLVSGNDCRERIHVVDGAVCVAPPFLAHLSPYRTYRTYEKDFSWFCRVVSGGVFALCRGLGVHFPTSD